MIALVFLSLLAAAHAQYAMLGSGLTYSTYGGLGVSPYAYNLGYGGSRAATYGAAAVPLSYSGAVPVMAAAVPAAHSVQSHAQDELGQYAYGYATDTSAKKEVKTADGVVRGSYTYLAADGSMPTVNYIADALGYRILDAVVPTAGTIIRRRRGLYNTAFATAAPFAVATRYNYPEYTGVPYTAAIAAHPMAAVGYAARPLALTHPVAAVGYAARPLALAHPVAAVGYAARPLALAHPMAAVGYAARPLAVAAPVAISRQHHAQDELGQYNYGYAGLNSAKKEVKTADGVVRGAYSYIDAFGLPQQVKYVADAFGYRVQATNLPVGPASAGSVGLGPVANTPAVAYATQQHLAAHAAATAHALG